MNNVPIKAFRVPILLSVLFVFWVAARAHAIVSQNTFEKGDRYLQTYFENQASSFASLMKAYEELYAVERQQPRWGEVQQSLGLAYVELSQWRGKIPAQREQWLLKAQKAFRRAVRLEPIHAVYHANLARCLAALGRTEEAENEYHRAVALRPQNPDGYYRLGCFLLQQGDSAEAIESFKKALEYAIHPQVLFQQCLEENRALLSEQQCAVLQSSFQQR